MTDLPATIADDLPEGLRAHAADGVLTVTFDRAEKRNAITYAMYRALVRLIDHAAADDGVRALSFAAAGSIFTAGHDVSGFAQGAEIAFDEKPSYLFMQRLSTFPKPVVAALNGDAVGIGATMLLHCDLVYAVPGCTLVFPFTKMGLIPEFGSTFHLPQLIGHRRTMALFLGSGRCSAEQAVQWGIVNELAAPDRLAAAAAGALADIVALSPEAVRHTKALAKAPHADGTAAAIATEAALFHELLASDFVRNRIGAIQRSISGR